MNSRWRRTPIGEVCRVVSGTTPSTSVDSYWNGEVVWITPTDLGALNGRILLKTERTITEAAREDHRIELLPAGAVIMSSRAPIGHLAITGVPACLNQGCKGFLCGGLVDPTFLLHALRANMGAIREVGRGATFAEISKSALERFELEIPLDIEEQRLLALKIDRQLQDSIDARNAARDQVSRALHMTQAHLRQAFFGNVPIRCVVTEQSDSQVPHDWTWHRLLHVARLESGHTPSRRRPEWWGGNVSWLALPDIRKLHGKYAYETMEKTNDAGLANSSARLLPPGTVCLSRTASIGFVTILGKPMATSQDFANWICDPEVLDPEFLMYALMASQNYLRELGSGAVHKTIYMPSIESFQVCAPEIDEQRRIARSLRARLAGAESLIDCLKGRLAEIERLPQRLLAAAFGQAA